MHILMTGATGFIGSALITHWREKGHQFTALVRDRKTARQKLGDEVKLVGNLDTIPTDAKFDAAINLAGAPIAAKLWSKARQQDLLDSRVGTTVELVALLKRLTDKPHTVISGSAAGYYGRCGSEQVSEDTPPQDIFMSSLCRRWEEAAAPITELGIRLVISRTSVVLGNDGGAFPQLARPIRFGVGATLGSGTQYFPWIHKADLIRLFDHLLMNEEACGAYNAVAPDAITSAAFNKTLAKKLKRHLFFRVPERPLRLALGEMADLFVSGQNMAAAKAQQSGFEFTYPTLGSALDNLL